MVDEDPLSSSAVQTKSPGETREHEPPKDGRVNNGNAPGSREALRQHAIQQGERKNPDGINGWRKAQARFREFAMSLDEDGAVRDDNVLRTTYKSALIPGPRGAADRKLWHEQVRGKAKQQLELSGQDGSPLRVVAMLPDNGRGPGDKDPDDGEPGASQE